MLSDSQESEFVYDLPSGYNSQDEGNPDCISVISSGDSSVQINEEPQLDLSNYGGGMGGIDSISMLNLDSLQGQISNAHRPKGGGGSGGGTSTMNHLEVKKNKSNSRLANKPQ